jgi:hypothetical protein
MSQQRKPRSDSITGQIQLQEALQNPIIAPCTLTADEYVIFEELLDGLPRLKWDKQSIRMAARLSRLEVYLDALIDQTILEGPTSENARGTPVTNPVHTAMLQTAGSVKMLRASLGLSASQRGIHKTTTPPAEEAEAAAKAALKAVGGKNLLA